VIRAAWVICHAAFAALGAALVARPALLWLRSQGLLSPAPAWDVPLGGLFAVCTALVAIASFWLAHGLGGRRRGRLPVHAVFLALIATCFVLRATAGEPRPPPSPGPPLLLGLRTAARELDRDYRGRYAPDREQLDAALASEAAATSGYRRLGSVIGLRSRILSEATAAQTRPLDGDPPGTIYVAISTDGQTAWLTALDGLGIFRLASGQPAAVLARAGAHSLPGQDPLVPDYPGARPPR